MIQRLGCAAVIVSLSVSALAQTGPCSGGSINPLFTLIPPGKGDAAFRLQFEHLTTHTFFGPPSESIAGNDIIITQIPVDLPPPPMTVRASDLNCNLQTASLGLLASGTYNVTWNYIVPSGVPGGQPSVIESHTFSFSVADVPALSGPALFGLMLLLGLFGLVMLRR